MGWFKSLQVYHLNELPADSPEAFIEKLEATAFAPCLPNLPMSMGWVPPLGGGTSELGHPCNQYIMICLQLSEKVIPSSVIQEGVAERVRELETKYERKIRKREKDAIKDAVYQDLLPQAFCKSTKVPALIDWNNKLLMIDCAVQARLEYVLLHLNKTFGELDFVTPEYAKVSNVLTRWVKTGQYPDAVEIGESSVLHDPNQQGRTIRSKLQDIFAKNFIALLNDGYEVGELSVSWKEQVSFTVKESLMLTQIKFHDEVLESAKDNYTETEAQRIDADTFIMAELLSQLIEDVESWFAVADAPKHQASEAAALV